jgi:predicted nuclease with TOPRIM domain
MKYLELFDALEEGLIDRETFNDTLESIDSDLELKADNITYIIKEFSDNAESLKKEEARLRERRASLEKKVDVLKERLLQSFMIAGTEKLKTQKHTNSVSNTPPSLEVSDDAKIPKKYYIKQEPKLDNAMLKEALKNGVKITGATLNTRKTLRIR